MLKILGERAESVDQFTNRGTEHGKMSRQETPLEITRQIHNHAECGLQGQKRDPKTKGIFSAMDPVRLSLTRGQE